MLISASLLSGCGGGGSTSNSTNQSSTVDNSQPQRLSADNMANVHILARDSFPAPTITNDNTSITLTHSGSSVSSDLHYQFFINTDNNPETGFNFDNEVWDDAGTDYIIEDGRLFKSTANDSSWSWNTNVGDVNYTTTASSVSVTVDQSLLHGLAPQIRIGFIIRDENWDVISIWPGASVMALASLDVAPPTDTVAPVISLNGSQNITIQKDSIYEDAGATALDNFDGDITNRIETVSNLNTSAVGTYQITYSVSDLAGNPTSKTRTIIVSEQASNSIVVDGSINDWNEIPVLTTSNVGTIKVTDSIKNIYIMIEGYQPLGENTQIFIDSDNNTFNGFRFEGQVWTEGGADYMIENNHLSQSTASSGEWSWDHDISPISFIKNNNIIEVAIPKDAIKTRLEPTINVGFVNRTDDWAIESVLPEAGMKPHKLTAINTLDLIPGICGKIWETDGTAENTQESFLNTYRGTWGNIWEKKDNVWYGFRYLETDYGNDISFERYEGTLHNWQVLPFSVVRDEEIGNGQVTDMKFFGDIQYFIFKNEIWRTTSSSSGNYRLKIFDDMLGRSLQLVTTSDDIYVYDSGSIYTSNIINNLWKITNGDQVELDQTFDNEESIFLGSYNGKLYTSRKNSSGEYIIYQNDRGIETTLSPSFTGKPHLSSTNGALYISDAHPDDRNVTKYFWSLNESTNSFEQVTENRIGLVGSVTSVYRDISSVQGNQFVLRNYQAFINAPVGSLFNILNSGEKELIDEGRTINSRYLDGKLYLNILTNTQIGTGQYTDNKNTLSVIDDASGVQKTLATCDIPE